MKKKATRKEGRERLENFRLGCELVKAYPPFFPDLTARLEEISDPRHQSYILCSSRVLLATRILSAYFTSTA